MFATARATSGPALAVLQAKLRAELKVRVLPAAGKMRLTEEEKVITKREARGKIAIVFPAKKMTNTHEFPSELLSNEDYNALVESLIDEEDDMESEFSMYKCAMIKDGTYYAKAAED